MKRTIILLIVVFTATITACAQSQTQEKPEYQLFPTQNIWTFIKLNTRTGQMWLIQWSTEEDERFETYLSLEPLVPQEKEVNGRFTLYPTENIYNFILLDQLNGRVWQAQWSHELENRVVLPIE
jgi:hypothetical protein